MGGEDVAYVLGTAHTDLLMCMFKAMEEGVDGGGERGSGEITRDGNDTLMGRLERRRRRRKEEREKKKERVSDREQERVRARKERNVERESERDNS